MQKGLFLPQKNLLSLWKKLWLQDPWCAYKIQSHITSVKWKKFYWVAGDLMRKLVDDWCFQEFIKMALEVFSSIRYYLKPEEISIDNWVFKLHYRVATAIMIGSSAIGVAKQYFGDPINCQVITLLTLLHL